MIETQINNFLHVGTTFISAPQFQVVLSFLLGQVVNEGIHDLSGDALVDVLLELCELHGDFIVCAKFETR
jgi:hypothetical protein